MKKALAKLLHSFNQLVLGRIIFAPLHKRLFLLSVWSALVLSIVALIVDIAAGFPTLLIVTTAITVVILLYIYYRVRFRTDVNYEKYIFTFVFVVLLIVPLTWLLNAGLDGANLMLLFIAFMSVYFLLKPSQRFAAFLIFMLMLLSLLYIEFYHPDYIYRYPDVTQRMVDLFLGSALYLTVTYAFLNIIFTNTEFERERIRLRNTQLDQLARKHSDLNVKLNKTILELETTNLSKDKFISIISHDLRSPFQALLGVAQILDEDYDSLSDAEKKSVIGKLRLSLDRQYKFLEELLLWGQLQRNTGVINMQSADINFIIDSSVEIMKDNIGQKNIKIGIAHARDPHIVTDVRLIATVFRNILSNAVKFSLPGSCINISASSNSSMITIAFEDQGMGMSEKELEKLFRLDIHFSKKGTEGETGTGLGMIVCAEIMSKLHGSISAESEPGKGTAFFVRLPRNENNSPSDSGN